MSDRRSGKKKKEATGKKKKKNSGERDVGGKRQKGSRCWHSGPWPFPGPEALHFHPPSMSLCSKLHTHTLTNANNHAALHPTFRHSLLPLLPFLFSRPTQSQFGLSVQSTRHTRVPSKSVGGFHSVQRTTLIHQLYAAHHARPHLCQHGNTIVQPVNSLICHHRFIVEW